MVETFDTAIWSEVQVTIWTSDRHLKTGGDGGSPEVVESDVVSGLLLLSHQVVSNPFATPWTVARQTPLSMGFPRQEHWSGWPPPPPGDLPDSGIKPMSLSSHALAGGCFTTEQAGKPSPLVGLCHTAATGQAHLHTEFLKHGRSKLRCVVRFHI